MARWINIWNGVADIPEEFKEIISSVKKKIADTGVYYAGWEAFEEGTIAHSGGTPNYSSRIMFSDKDKSGVCVLTSLNVAASTDSLCNGIYGMIHGKAKGSIVTDVWTVFDIIFTVVSALGLLILILALFIKKLKALIPIGCFTLIILASICIVMPLAFGANLWDMMHVWAPYCFTGGLISLTVCAVTIIIKLLITKKKKTVR